MPAHWKGWQRHWHAWSPPWGSWPAAPRSPYPSPPHLQSLGQTWLLPLGCPWYLAWRVNHCHRFSAITVPPDLSIDQILDVGLTKPSSHSASLLSHTLGSLPGDKALVAVKSVLLLEVVLATKKDISETGFTGACDEKRRKSCLIIECWNMKLRCSGGSLSVWRHVNLFHILKHFCSLPVDPKRMRRGLGSWVASTLPRTTPAKMMAKVAILVQSMNSSL